MSDPDTTPGAPKSPAWLTTKEVAARLGKTPKDITKLVMRGYLHPIQKTGTNLFAHSEVEALARPGRRASPWFAGPLRRRARLDAADAKRSVGKEAALVFRLLDQQRSLRAIVVRLNVAPHRVRALHREWLRSLEQGAPIEAHALGDSPDLDTLAESAASLFSRGD